MMSSKVRPSIGKRPVTGGRAAPRRCRCRSGARRRSGQDFGCHVERRAGEFAAAGTQLCGVAARAEVHQDDASLLLAHHVAGLDVAIDQPRLVHLCERSSDADPDRRGLMRSERALCGEDVLEGLALDELHAQADLTFMPLHVVDVHDVGIADARQGAAFAQDAFTDDVQGGVLRLQDLQRHFAFELRVPGAIDRALAALAESRTQLVASPALCPTPVAVMVSSCDGGSGAAPGPGSSSVLSCTSPTLASIRRLRSSLPVVLVLNASFDARPVHGRAVRDGRGDFEEDLFTGHR